MMGPILLMMTLFPFSFPFSNDPIGPDVVAHSMVQRLELNIRYLERAQLDGAPDPETLERYYSEWLRHQSSPEILGVPDRDTPQESGGLGGSAGGSSTGGSSTGGGSTGSGSGSTS